MSEIPESSQNRHPESGRNVEGFYDFSLWEKRKRDGEKSLKQLIRDGVHNTSAICVLIGTETWKRPWVRYEIARSVINGRGLLAVHINSISHHQPPYKPHAEGYNPCNMLGVALNAGNNNYYLCEYQYIENKWVWKWYKQYTRSVKIPKYMQAPTLNNPVSLGAVTKEYNWANNGPKKYRGVD